MELQAGVDPVGGRRVVGAAVGDVPRDANVIITNLGHEKNCLYIFLSNYGPDLDGRGHRWLQ